jgi:acid phosphatase (class A)
MAYLLIDMVPEREVQLIARADEFARQRMVCGVHFRSDIEAGRLGARWLLPVFTRSAAFREDEAAAIAELRAALKLPPKLPRS